MTPEHGHDLSRDTSNVGEHPTTSHPAPVAGAPYVLNDDTHLLEYVKVLSKRRWTVATVFAAVLLIVTVYTFTVTPQYEARVRLLIEDDSPNVVMFQQVVEDTLTTNDNFDTQLRLLESRSLARTTLETLELWEHPTFSGQAAPWAHTWSQLEIGDTGGAAADTLKQSRTIDRFLSELTTRSVPNSRLVDVTFRSENPRLATTVISTYAQSYIDQNLEFRFLASLEATEWLSERLADQRLEVERSEAALYEYRQEHDAISLEDSENIVVQRLSALNAAVTRARTDMIAKEADYLQLQASQNEAATFDTSPAVASSVFVQELKSDLADLLQQQAQLSENLGPRHPNMIAIQTAIEVVAASLEREVDDVVLSVRNDFLAAQSEERSLARELEAQKNAVLAMNQIGIGYGVLLRDAESNRQLYESLLQRAKETGVSSELRNSNIRIVDAAEVPREPVSPRIALNLIVALFGGGVLGLGLAFFFEYLDSRIKTPDDVRAHLGLSSLGLIPTTPKKALKMIEGHLIRNGVPANYAEAFKTARSGVLFSCADDRRSFVIASTGPGEGKSSVASNLAVGFAQTEQRVLLIDGDMRRPSLHKIFGMDQEPGLSDLVVGNVKVSNALRKTSVSGLWLLTAGTSSPNPAELLGSKRFQKFLGTLHEHFDWVLIDSPPVMAVTDACLIAHSTAGVIFVVGAEMTSRYAAQQAVDHLDAAGAKFVGAILNRVNLERNAYYYSRYYRSDYQQYYTQPPTQDGSRRPLGNILQL